MRSGGPALLFALALLVASAALAGPAVAQTITTSAAPRAVEVTVYRAPDRASSEPVDLRWPRGFALITETRDIAIPAGEADIRFEGVAGGILPESAIVTGLPDGVVEKNQDALLLSPGSLIDRALGSRVHLRRTSRATGAVREEEAVVRTGADGGVIVQTASGFEALRCSGSPETVVYDRVPAGLSARPTLSVRTRSARASRGTVTLSYLSSGFDWQANYVATLSADGAHMDLFGWVTIANGDETSFVGANAQAVAGRVNRVEPAQQVRPQGRALELQCYPLGTTTSDLAAREAYAAPPPPPPVMMEMSTPMSVISEEIVVTGSRISRMTVRQEELGDLKLYRIPEPVTVAARAQKQVALLDRRGVIVEPLYRRAIGSGVDPAPVPASRVFATRNRVAEGLGLPLPAGPVAMFALRDGRPVLIGEGTIGDRAVGEDVDIVVGAATGIYSQVTSDDNRGFALTVTNDRTVPVRFEAEFRGNVAGSGADAGTAFARKNGLPVWRATVPANGTRTVRYRFAD